jgi:hypothetical protein
MPTPWAGPWAPEPDVIVHQLTAVPPAVNMRRFDREFALTNRLPVALERG